MCMAKRWKKYVISAPDGKSCSYIAFGRNDVFGVLQHLFFLYIVYFECVLLFCPHVVSLSMCTTRVCGSLIRVALSSNCIGNLMFC